jgi:hypothetical protein
MDGSQEENSYLDGYRKHIATNTHYAFSVVYHQRTDANERKCGGTMEKMEFI